MRNNENPVDVLRSPANAQHVVGQLVEYFSKTDQENDFEDKKTPLPSFQSLTKSGGTLPSFSNQFKPLSKSTATSFPSSAAVLGVAAPKIQPPNSSGPSVQSPPSAVISPLKIKVEMVLKSLNQPHVAVNQRPRKTTPRPNFDANIVEGYLHLGLVVISTWRPTLGNISTPVSYVRKGSCRLDCTIFIYSLIRKSMKSRTRTSHRVAQQLMKVLKCTNSIAVICQRCFVNFQFYIMSIKLRIFVVHLTLIDRENSEFVVLSVQNSFTFLVHVDRS